VQFTFEDYVLDPERRELTRGAKPVAIGPQVFDLLLHLVRNREHVVSKDELLDGVWDGRIVSESTLTSHINAVRKALADNGQEQRLIRTVARKGFRFVGDVGEIETPDSLFAARTAPRSSSRTPADALPLPDKPSIAALPFVNLSGDAEQEYFTDGVVEDIISALSRIRWLFVIARNSSFTYKGRAVDVKQVGRELGVRYVLEGSVRKAANRVRITGQLVDAASGGHLWAQRYEGTLDDIFDLQDRISESVVGAIAPQLERAEIERAERKPTESLDAYDHFLRGMARFHAGTQDGLDGALSCFRKAIALDPEFASAYGMAAWCVFSRSLNGGMNDAEQEIAEGTRLARCAVDLGKSDAVALARGGHALAHFSRDLDVGIDFLDRALVLNPNLAAAWFLGGYLRLFRGESEEAINRFEHAIRLSPLDSEMFRMQTGVALAHLIARRFDAASSWAAKAFHQVPVLVLPGAVIAASHALAGRTEDALSAMQHLLKFNPGLRLASLEKWLPFQRQEDLATFAEGLRRAGLPE
jgi:TolB-like protein